MRKITQNLKPLTLKVSKSEVKSGNMPSVVPFQQLSQPSNRHSPTHAMAVNCDSKNNLTVELAPMQSVTVTVTAAANSTLQNSSNQNCKHNSGTLL